MSYKQPQRLRRTTINNNPFEQFHTWFEDARRTALKVPMAMTLSSLSSEGRISSRIVLLARYDNHGFVFFTNYGSRKAQEVTLHPCVSLLFYWEPLGRQIRIEGNAVRLSAAESDLHFISRPRGNQISAYASYQSQEIESRDDLIAGFEKFTRKFENQDVPRPSHWGGYRIVPDLFEFWQDGEHRLHDRLRYVLQKEGEWKIERLAP